MAFIQAAPLFNQGSINWYCVCVYQNLQICQDVIKVNILGFQALRNHRGISWLSAIWVFCKSINCFNSLIVCEQSIDDWTYQSQEFEIGLGPPGIRSVVDWYLTKVKSLTMIIIGMLIARYSNFCVICDVSRELSFFTGISISGFLGKLGGKGAEVVIQSLQSPFPLWNIGIVSMGVGFVDKVLKETFPRKTTQPDIKKISEEVRKQ